MSEQCAEYKSAKGLKEKAVAAYIEAVRREKEWEKQRKEKAKEFERNKLVSCLQTLFKIEPLEIELTLTGEDENPFWEATVDGLRFRLLHHPAASGQILHIAGKCIHDCGNDAWYEVHGLEELGAFLLGFRSLKPCYTCSMRESDRCGNLKPLHAVVNMIRQLWN